MRTFNVTAHPYFYASIFVNANNEDEAMKKANEMDTDTILSELNLNNVFHVKDLLFKLHEVKANYAEPTEDENSFEVTLTITYTSSSPMAIEADDENEALINPTYLQSLYGVLPIDRLVITFFKDALDRLIEEGKIEKYLTI